MAFLQNCWYLASWSTELSTKTILARTILEKPIALFRQADGSPAAIQDQCPHKFAPLSAGTVEDNSIRCRYHGLAFDGRGRCSDNPHGAITKNIQVTSYPVVECFRGIWIWMGDPARADIKTIPDLSYLSAAPETAFSAGYIHSFGHYELMTDNIMDLSHTDYLHPGTLGGAGITNTKPEIVETQDYIEQIWFVPKTKPAPLLASLFPDLPAETDTLQSVRWYAPSVIRLVASTIATGGSPEDGYRNINAHVLTPETERTTHYFFAATRNYKVEDGDLNQYLAKAREQIFATEDKPMIEKIQRVMANRDFWSMNPVIMPIDVVPTRIRRRLRKMIDVERKDSFRIDEN